MLNFSCNSCVAFVREVASPNTCVAAVFSFVAMGLDYSNHFTRMLDLGCTSWVAFAREAANLHTCVAALVVSDGTYLFQESCVNLSLMNPVL